VILMGQTSNLTNEHRGGTPMPLRYSFLFRVVWMLIALTALMAVTICTYQGTENLIGWLSQWSI
jgi:hypothetical protein